MAVILFGVFIALLLLGVPVAFAICSAAATTMFAGFGDAKMMIVVQRMFASCDSFSLIAVPFFIFAGDLLGGRQNLQGARRVLRVPAGHD